MMKVELTGNAIEFFEEFPHKIEQATKIALQDIGMHGVGFAKQTAPYDTGNLRRSITYSGIDNFPLFDNKKTYLSGFIEVTGKSGKSVPKIQEDKGPLSEIDDTLFIGTNLVYSHPMEKMYRYMDFTEQYLTQNVVERIFNREIDRVLSHRLVFTNMLEFK